MEHREPEFAIPHTLPIVPASRVLLRGRETWRNLNHNGAPSALAPLAWVRAPCFRPVAITKENLADSNSSRVGRFCRL